MSVRALFNRLFFVLTLSLADWAVASSMVLSYPVDSSGTGRSGIHSDFHALVIETLFAGGPFQIQKRSIPVGERSIHEIIKGNLHIAVATLSNETLKQVPAGSIDYFPEPILNTTRAFYSLKSAAFTETALDQLTHYRVGTRRLPPPLLKITLGEHFNNVAFFASTQMAFQALLDSNVDIVAGVAFSHNRDLNILGIQDQVTVIAYGPKLSSRIVVSTAVPENTRQRIFDFLTHRLPEVHQNGALVEAMERFGYSSEAVLGLRSGLTGLEPH